MHINVYCVRLISKTYILFVKYRNKYNRYTLAFLYNEKFSHLTSLVFSSHFLSSTFKHHGHSEKKIEYFNDFYINTKIKIDCILYI